MVLRIKRLGNEEDMWTIYYVVRWELIDGTMGAVYFLTYRDARRWANESVVRRRRKWSIRRIKERVDPGGGYEALTA